MTGRVQFNWGNFSHRTEEGISLALFPGPATPALPFYQSRELLTHLTSSRLGSCCLGNAWKYHDIISLGKELYGASTPKGD